MDFDVIYALSIEVKSGNVILCYINIREDRKGQINTNGQSR